MESYYSPDTFRHPAGKDKTNSSEPELTKWRRVGLVSGTNVHLDTIVWPGGDIVVSGKINIICKIVFVFLGIFLGHTQTHLICKMYGDSFVLLARRR